MAVAGAWRYAVGDRCLVNRLQQTIASRAPREGRCGGHTREPPQDLDELPAGLNIPDTVAVRDGRPLQQVDIPRQQHAIADGSARRESGVRVVRAVLRVESGQPEIRRESPEVNVHHEAQVSRARGTE